MSDKEFSCPICNGHELGPYNGRENARCAGCGSLERTRYLWKVMLATGALKPSLRVLHVAPELALMKRFAPLYGENYHPCDLFPEKYKNSVCPVFPLDACKDLEKLPRGAFDLIVHNHVLEHLPCEVGTVIERFNQLVAPGGKHFFSVPFRGAVTRENLSPDLPREERIRQFGQDDHLRLFGTRDFPRFLEERFGGTVRLFDPVDIIPKAELTSSGIPSSVYDSINGHSVFFFERAAPSP